MFNILRLCINVVFAWKATILPFQTAALYCSCAVHIIQLKGRMTASPIVNTYSKPSFDTRHINGYCFLFLHRDSLHFVSEEQRHKRNPPTLHFEVVKWGRILEELFCLLWFYETFSWPHGHSHRCKVAFLDLSAVEFPPTMFYSQQ